MRKVGEDLTRALEKAMAYEEAENTRLDRPERYRRESRKQWRICGNRSRCSSRAQSAPRAVSRSRARLPAVERRSIDK